MKKLIFSLITFLSLGFMACNNDSTTSETTDSTTTTTSTTDATTTTSSSDYSAMADTFQRNSDAGK
ncbi:MAG TPA: hypothetical protein VJ499_14020, partial [Flavisolibacter sp.]|nr:hypothetical protein [Flavisolibacter sp.]